LQEHGCEVSIMEKVKVCSGLSMSKFVRVCRCSISVVRMKGLERHWLPSQGGKHISASPLKNEALLSLVLDTAGPRWR
jgi:hypothetical protein